VERGEKEERESGEGREWGDERGLLTGGHDRGSRVAMHCVSVRCDMMA
jgi:hypothetical protein